ncbi:MAG: FtsW/RodA/SpoVE family cell cycle protein [Alphaproteobacteria bacterium]|nr:FtsW/RodA/SpoVE family cell cycle protein [Alphaproteobacteria bacterium]
MFLSIILVITASPFVAMRIGASPYYFINNHISYLLLSCGVIFVISTLDKRKLVLLIMFGFSLSVLLMLLVIFFGTDIKGARRWIYLFGFSIQPSEFMKVFFPAFLALIWKRMELAKKDKISIYLTLTIIYAAVIALLVKQPDFGSSILVSLVFLGILFITGISYLWVIIFSFIASILSVLAYFTIPHVNYRVNSFFFEEKSYQTLKSLEAIFNGKIFGLGAGQGVVKQYLPDSHTDFIFAVGIEEFGLIFGLFLILIYLNIIYRLFYIIQRQQDSFNIIATAGSLLLLAIQTFIHIASNINLIPTKGMTLPLISYGGSSLIAMAILIGLILNLSKKDIQNIILKVE